MPYTPPTQQSPATSTAHTPIHSRPDSVRSSSPPRSPGPRPNLPRSASSASYLSRARRSPTTGSESTPLYNGQLEQVSDSHNKSALTVNTSLRASPPPVSNDAIPRGALTTPPDSTQNSSTVNSSDDEAGFRNGESATNLAELERAVRRSLGIDRAGSPTSDDTDLDQNNGDLKEQKSEPESGTIPKRLTQSARKISHSRSSTESSIFVPADPVQQSNSGSDGSDEDDDLEGKPPLLRKKSGELVKPAIRPQARRKVSSMPGTPTYSKAVHFNDDIEQVRHFLQVDRPIAVSAGGSPAELADDEEFPFGSYSNSTSLELRLGRFPRDSFERLSQPIRLERLSLSGDQKSLVGSCAVANIAFHKLVVARFTFDFWKTTSEVVAEYNTDSRLQNRTDGYDPFLFSVKISDLANLEKKTMLLCVRYNVNGQEYWDNNDALNYQADFVVKEGQSGSQSNKTKSGGSIPRSKHSASAGRPHSMSSLEDDFASNFDASPFQFKNATARKPILPDTPPPRRVHQAGQPFGSRYDFGASLSAALTQAQAQLGDRSGIKAKQPQSQSVPLLADPKNRPQPPVPNVSRRIGIAPPVNSGAESPRPETLMANKQSRDSKAYQEFISKFCFAGTKKPPQQTSTQANHVSNDGTQDENPGTSNHTAQPDSEVKSFRGMTGIRSPPYNPSPEVSGRSSPVPSAGHMPDNESPDAFAYPYGQKSPHDLFSSGNQTPIVQS